MCCLYLCVVFFFKQKTAYEMRISDWSSDVCSSDLAVSSSQARAWRCASAISSRDISLDRSARHCWPSTLPPSAARLNHLCAWIRSTSTPPEDRKSVVQGKGVSVRVDLGGRRMLKKKNNHTKSRPYSSYSIII